MNKLVKRIWWIVLPTALAVLAFQLYWLRTNYIEQRDSFEQVAADALQKAYDQSVMESLEKMGQQKAERLKKKPKKLVQTTTSKITLLPAGQVSDQKIDSIASSIVQGLAGAKKTNKTGIENTTITLSQKWSDKPDSVVNQEINPRSANLDFNHFLAGILSAAQITEIDTLLIRKSLLKELKIRHILLPFSLKLLAKDTVFKDKDAGLVYKNITTPKKKMTLLLRFEKVGPMLFLKILWPVVLSFLLVLLITGCIWLLWRIIVRQKKLEVMKNDFISNISHELKTPLSILSATNEALLKFGGIQDREKTERYLLLEQAELRKLQGLVENIMTLTRMEHREDELIGRQEKTDVKALLDQVLSRFSELSGLELHTRFLVENAHLNTYPAGLKIILSNLIDNAIKYTPGIQKEVFIQIEERTGDFVFSVRDQGIGIDKAYLPFIFDKFYRVPQGNVHEVKGYGLGLSYVKTIVGKLGGDIQAESTVNRGTTFTFQLKKS
ncbi:sensor histidine kinase [Pedobacter nutrimenti]|uniref:histidine kinase n=1 Tax=Pedobacter nutrimenti TaxID=1241337 RepID=A0A318UFI9_9SPHI|nr:HAMP domain-containing sensor histidine kinase [Pedobacter nutrimenti]PYF74931.1 phospho-acceptor domain-containing protein [Pedobacter nutrimenti]